MSPEERAPTPQSELPMLILSLLLGSQMQGSQAGGRIKGWYKPGTLMEAKFDYGRFHGTKAVKICKSGKVKWYNSKIKYFHFESVYAPFRSPFKCLFLFQRYNWQYFNKSNKLGSVPSAVTVIFLLKRDFQDKQNFYLLKEMKNKITHYWIQWLNSS